MRATADIWVYLMALGILALLGFFFWHVVSVYVGAGRKVAAYLDSSSERRRAALDHERKFGKPPLWLRMLRVALVLAMIGLMAVAFWNKTRLG